MPRSGRRDQRPKPDYPYSGPRSRPKMPGDRDWRGLVQGGLTETGSGRSAGSACATSARLPTLPEVGWNCSSARPSPGRAGRRYWLLGVKDLPSGFYGDLSGVTLLAGAARFRGGLCCDPRGWVNRLVQLILIRQAAVTVGVVEAALTLPGRDRPVWPDELPALLNCSRRHDQRQNLDQYSKAEQRDAANGVRYLSPAGVPTQPVQHTAWRHCQMRALPLYAGESGNTARSCSALFAPASSLNNRLCSAQKVREARTGRLGASDGSRPTFVETHGLHLPFEDVRCHHCAVGG